MKHLDVEQWVHRHQAAWTSGGTDALHTVFTDDVVVRPAPWADPLVGLDAVRAYWPEDIGLEVDAAVEVVALDPPTAVVRLHVEHLAPAEASASFRRLWVLAFAADGRVERFEDWPFRA